MNRLFIFLLSLVMVLPAMAQRTFTIRGNVTDGRGHGIAGVVVNDGVSFTRTNSHGVYMLSTDTMESKFVSISVPSDYELPRKQGIADGFYIPVAMAVKGNTDFTLTRRTRVSDRFTYVAISDPQVKTRKNMDRWRDETIRDLHHTVDSLSHHGEVVGMTLGDLVWDRMDLFPEYRASLEGMPWTVFQTIGNHDFDLRYQDLHNMPTGSPVWAEQSYERTFGPVCYSFNIGRVHVVTLKNINYMGGKNYAEGLTGKVLDWLSHDLAMMPRGYRVFINMHAAGWNTVEADGNIRDAAQLEKILSPYQTDVFCGHTHFFQNIVVSPRLFQHNIGAACGAWWKGDISRCGAPDGYLIVSVNGDDVEWQWHPTHLDKVQIHRLENSDFCLYDYTQGGTQKKGYVVANVWDWDPLWTVTWSQDGKIMGPMTQYQGYDDAYSRRFNGDVAASTLTPHLFRCRPAGSWHSISVTVTDRFGRASVLEIAASK